MDLLVYQIQKMDGSAESIIIAVKLIILEFYEKPKEMTKVKIDVFFEKFSKILLGKFIHQEKVELRKIYESLKEIIGDGQSYHAQFCQDGPLKESFGSKLKTYLDLIRISLGNEKEKEKLTN